MNIALLANPIGGGALFNRIDADVNAALNAVTTVGAEFIVNTESARWYAIRRGRPTPCVMNQAEYISRRFQARLSQLGWHAERSVNNQRIDAYVEVPGHTTSYEISRANLIALLSEYWESNPESDAADFMARLYHGYHLRGAADLTGIEPAFHHYFSERSVEHRGIVRVGLEFETGNIASSFRALNKLDNLYCAHAIDLGVFITSHNKASAYELWPPSNRNGSFQELQNRNYKAGLRVPLIEYSFRADGTSATAPYLADDGTTYIPQATGQKVTYDGLQYECYIRFGDDPVLHLLPIPLGPIPPV